jgi:hypothetical protein
LQAAAQLFSALSHEPQAEMAPVRNPSQVKPGSIVLDGHADPTVLSGKHHLDVASAAVFAGVRERFLNDPENL